MQAIILAGGQGTRLRELHPNTPKALVPIAGKPFLEWQLEWLARGGVTDFHIAAGHLAAQLETWTKHQPSFRITVSREPQALGTGGGLKYVEPFIQSDPFYVINGDSLMPNLDFQSLEKFHRNFPMIGKNPKIAPDGATTNSAVRSHAVRRDDLAPDGATTNSAARSHAVRRDATIAVSRIESAGRYGTVEFDGNGMITAFREKAGRDAGWINGGVYLMSKGTLEGIPSNTNVSIETDLFPGLAAKGLLAAFRGEPPMLDMGTPDGIRAMEAYLRKEVSR